MEIGPNRDFATALCIMSRMGWFRLALLLLAGVLLYAFYAQNSLRQSELSMDLGFVAWKLSSAQPVPLLLGVAFLLGAVPLWIWGWWRGLALQGQIRQLRQELAVGSDRKKDGWS